MQMDCAEGGQVLSAQHASGQKINKPVFGIFIFSNENDDWRSLLDQRGFINRPLRSFL